MRENRPSGSEGGVAFGPSLPLSGPFVNPPCRASPFFVPDPEREAQLAHPTVTVSAGPEAGAQARTGLAGEAPLAGAAELDQVGQFGQGGQVGFDAGQRVGNG